MKTWVTIHCRPSLAIVIVLIVVLTGCAGFSPHPVTETWRRLGDGMTLVLHRPVTIPPGRSTVVIQGGEVIHGGRDRFQPFCELAIDHLAVQSEVVSPDRFTIERVRGQTLYTWRLGRPLRLAAAGRFRLAMAGDDLLPMEVTEAWRMRLFSPRQPQVILLLCGGAEDNFVDLARPPTVAEIRAALGRVASLR